MKKYILFLVAFFAIVSTVSPAVPCPDDYITLTAPVNKSAFTLNKETPGETVIFSWTDSGAAFYELVFSTQPDLSDPISVGKFPETSTTFTHAQLQELLFDAAPDNGLNKYYNNTLYWNVKVGGMIVGTSTSTFYMSGMKIFKDVRDSETIIYDVSFIPYKDGTYGIWLSQNLRATKDIHGNDLPGEIYSGTEDGSKIIQANPAYPQSFKSFVGNYYKQSEIVQLKEKLVPPGWKYPTWNDFEQLRNAAVAQSFQMEMLLNPSGYPDSVPTNYNEWNMNMAGFGRGGNNGNDWSLGESCKLNLAFMSFSYDTTSKPDSLSYAFSFNSWDMLNLPVTGGVPVRLIYTGDSEPAIEPAREPLAYESVEVHNYTGTTYYVDSEDGHDDNDGKSEEYPWKSLEKVNKTTFAPGDIIRFKRGGIWRGQLSLRLTGEEGKPIVFTSYGDGNKPIIQNSISRSNPDDWTETFAGSGIWQTNSRQDTIIDVGNLIFNHGEICAVKKDSVEKISGNLDFVKDTLSSKVFLKCDQNPALKYNSIELAITQDCIDYSGCHYVTFDDLAIRYGGKHGFGGHNTKNITIRRCDIYFIGGGYQGKARLGNGVEFWIGAENHLVENNRIWEIYDAALTNQGSGKNTQRNIKYRNNIIWNAEFSFEIWNHPNDATMQDIIFEKNTCVNAGKGWGHAQRPDRNGTHVLSYNNTATTSGVIIENNIFCEAVNHCIRMDVDWRSGLKQDNNLYFIHENGRIITWLINSKIYSFGKYQQVTGLDAHSVFTDPLFTDPVNNDFRLSVNSPVEVRTMGAQQW